MKIQLLSMTQILYAFICWEIYNYPKSVSLSEKENFCLMKHSLHVQYMHV